MEVPSESAVQEPPLVFVLSSMNGYGHASRAVAISQACPDQPVTLVAGAPAHDFLKANLPGRDNVRYVEPTYAMRMSDADYLDSNRPLAGEFVSCRVVVNDFLRQTSAIRKLIEEGGRRPFVGVYHSLADYGVKDESVARYQGVYKTVAGELDRLYLVEPLPEHSKPYQLDSGTLMIPCDPIVRKPTLDPAIVKAQLGLAPNDEFIYIQGGGVVVGEELNKVAQSLKEITGLEGLAIVVSLKGADGTPTSSDRVMYIQPRHDGHNLVAASAGVITKPGMGTICEAVASRKPLLLVDYPTGEAKSKFYMLSRVLGSLPFRLDVAIDVIPQIEAWLSRSGEISSRFLDIPCEGAKFVAEELTSM